RSPVPRLLIFDPSDGVLGLGMFGQQSFRVGRKAQGLFQSAVRRIYPRQVVGGCSVVRVSCERLLVARLGSGTVAARLFEQTDHGHRTAWRLRLRRDGPILSECVCDLAAAGVDAAE